jgi:hypothetical protein
MEENVPFASLILQRKRKEKKKKPAPLSPDEYEKQKLPVSMTWASERPSQPLCFGPCAVTGA